MSFGEQIDFEQMDPQEAQLLAGHTLLQMTHGVGTLADVETMRRMPALSPGTIERLAMPIDEFVITYAPDDDGLLRAANALLDWNKEASFYRVRHAAMLGKNALTSISHVSLRRADKLGQLISETCALPVPANHSAELSAYICDDPDDIPASIRLHRGGRLAIARTSMATLFSYGIPLETKEAVPKKLSIEKAYADIQWFENRYWLARAILQSRHNGPLYDEIGA